MQGSQVEQTSLQIGVDVGGTFTDLVAWDGRSLRIIKVPSTPPSFEQAVIEATNRAISVDANSDTGFPARARGAQGLESPCHEQADPTARLVHGSTVATNALLQRAGEPVAFITTEGFRDMLLIGRQNRPKLYALHVRRPPPIARHEHCFTVRGRIDASGQIVEPLDPKQIDDLISQISDLQLNHVAICLLFSFANPEHERQIARRCEAAGLTVSLSSDLLPEFREYERANTTAINASLRPVVAMYLQSLERGLPKQVSELRIMQSGGGTLDAPDAATQACKLVLSGPAGGVIGAAYVARRAGFTDVITYDMGGTSTDVALILDGRPQWTTSTHIDGLPIGLPMFDIHTVGAGGGSIAQVDVGGALRVGPKSAGAMPGPACYGRGGTQPTVTDANLVLGRILPGHFLGGNMKLDIESARRVIEDLAREIAKSIIETALGIVKVAEANMAHAIRAVSSRRGFDPRKFSLVSFGGAGGLHACGLAESLDLPRVIVPPYCGVLSALGMIVAPAVADASRTVVQLGDALDDDRLAAEFGAISELAMRQVSYEQTESVEAYADVRFKGQSHELKVRIDRPSRATIERAFREEYARLYGRAPEHRAIEIVTLRVRRIGRAAAVELPDDPNEIPSDQESIELLTGSGESTRAVAARRWSLPRAQPRSGPLLVIDDEATTYVPPGWTITRAQFGTLVLERK